MTTTSRLCLLKTRFFAADGFLLRHVGVRSKEWIHLNPSNILESERALTLLWALIWSEFDKYIFSSTVFQLFMGSSVHKHEIVKFWMFIVIHFAMNFKLKSNAFVYAFT